MMKVGVFGGTFNPIHWAHLVLAECVRDEAGLDEVVFVPTARPPHKIEEPLLPGHYRLKMVNLACREQAGFIVSRHEIDDREVSYSIHTLDYLKKQYPEGTGLRFIVGMDQLEEIETWKDYQRLLEEYGLYVVGRGDSGREDLISRYEKWVIPVAMPRLEISSTAIRQRIRQGRSIRFLVPGAVERYIKEQGLYRKEPEH
jgi:nicotinate-nucleotide adenylyltransferase